MTTKVSPAMQNLTSTYAFTGTVAGVTGGWILIASNAFSGVTYSTITGLSSTYDVYAIELSDIQTVDDAEAVYLRVGDSGGLDSGVSDYEFHAGASTEASSSYALVRDDAHTGFKLAGPIGNGTGEGFGAMYFLCRPGDGNMRPCINGTGIWITDSTVSVGGNFSGDRKAVITLDRLSIICSSGDFSGRFSVYGLKHS